MTPDTLWTATVIIFALAATLTQHYLARRQKASVLAHRHRVPERFRNQVSAEAHAKAADYTVARQTHATVSAWYGLLLLLLWTLGGGLDALDTGLRGLSGLQGTGFDVLLLIVFFTLHHLLELPVDIYATFAIEARFGFNRSTPGLYAADQLRQILLMIALGAPLAWVILSLMQGAGEAWWLYAWLVWTAFTLLLMWIFPTFIAPLFNRFDPLPDGELKTRIEALLARCGFTSNGLFVMDGSRRSSHGNAYFTGLGNAKRIVFFDTLLKQLTPEQTEAVLAHELGHFHHGHVMKRILSMSLVSLAGFAALGFLAAQDWFYEGLGVHRSSEALALILFMLILPAFTFALTPIMNHFSRKHEFEADAYAVEHSSGEHLIDALVRMYEDNASTLTPDALYSAWNDSHPPAPIRIAHIESLLQAGHPDSLGSD